MKSNSRYIAISIPARDKPQVRADKLLGGQERKRLINEHLLHRPRPRPRSRHVRELRPVGRPRVPHRRRDCRSLRRRAHPRVLGVPRVAGRGMHRRPRWRARSEGHAMKLHRAKWILSRAASVAAYRLQTLNTAWGRVAGIQWHPPAHHRCATDVGQCVPRRRRTFRERWDADHKALPSFYEFDPRTICTLPWPISRPAIQRAIRKDP